MLEEARENAERLGVEPKYLQMDVNRLDFQDQTFDVVVMRNVTWTLEHPEMVYARIQEGAERGWTSADIRCELAYALF